MFCVGHVASDQFFEVGSDATTVQSVLWDLPQPDDDPD